MDWLLVRLRQALARLGEPRHHSVQNSHQLLSVSSQRASDCKPIKGQPGDEVCAPFPQFPIDPPVDHPQHGLLVHVSEVRPQGPRFPPVSHRHTFHQLGGACVEGGELIQRDNDVSTKLLLSQDALLWRQLHQAARAVRSERHPLLVHLQRRLWVLLTVLLSVQLVSDRVVRHRKHLKAARVRDERLLSIHELVQPSRFGYNVWSWLKQQVIRVAEHELLPICPSPSSPIMAAVTTLILSSSRLSRSVVREQVVYVFERRVRRDRHVTRRVNIPVRRVYPTHASARPTRTMQNLETKEVFRLKFGKGSRVRHDLVPGPVLKLDPIVFKHVGSGSG
mmetsp:Transcript_11974/g.22453  ORF Transcript_11974/g.22453 Transcript_11974/m.22453 type:complete len:335 (-) Transcript_11974:159-1163(-)